MNFKQCALIYVFHCARYVAENALFVKMNAGKAGADSAHFLPPPEADAEIKALMNSP